MIVIWLFVLLLWLFIGDIVTAATHSPFVGYVLTPLLMSAFIYKAFV